MLKTKQNKTQKTKHSFKTSCTELRRHGEKLKKWGKKEKMTKKKSQRKFGLESFLRNKLSIRKQSRDIYGGI